MSIFGWASTAATVVAALGTTLIAATWRSRLAGPLVLAVLIAFLSLDDYIGIHESVGALWEPLGLWEKADRLVWPAIFLPLMAVTLVLALGVSAAGPARAGRLVRIGLIMLVAAVGLEIASQGLYQLGWDDPDLPLVIEVVAEEGAELAGWILVATGFLMIACTRLIAIGSVTEDPRRARADMEELAAGARVRMEDDR